MPDIVMARSSARIVVPSAQSITVFTQDSADVSQDVSGVVTLLGTVTGGQQTFGPFASGATIIVAASAHSVMYAIGSTPILRNLLHYMIQRAPIAIDAAGAIPPRALANGVITSNSLLGISCSLPTGAVLDSISDFKIDDAFEWCVIAAGLFGFTVTASAGHTIVGAAGVGSGTSGYFRTRKTAANTFVSYRIS
jgi:hypothetical protein